jgi:hypothetical protein
LSDYYLSKQAIRGGQADETKAFEQWKTQQAPYRREAQRRALMSDEDLRTLLEREMQGE